MLNRSIENNKEQLANLVRRPIQPPPRADVREMSSSLPIVDYMM